MERVEKIIFVFILLFVFIGTVSFTYGYFKAEFSYQSDELKVTTGTLKLDYADESPLIYKESFKPGDVITKTFTVENTGTLDTTYDLIWKVYKFKWLHRRKPDDDYEINVFDLCVNWSY